MSGDVERRFYRRPWRVDLTVRDGVDLPIPASRLASAVAAAATAAGAPSPAAVGLILSGDRELARLNRVAFGHRGATDVLSFPLLPPAAYPAHAGQVRASRPTTAASFVLPPGARPSLGEIVVSVARARRQAIAGRGGQDGRRRWSPADELRLLVMHGTLHLCGWDHAEPVEAAAMRRLEARLLGMAEEGTLAGQP